METPPPSQPPTPGPSPAAQPDYTPPSAGPTIRFDIIGQAFQMLFADLGTWAGASACIFVVLAAIMVPFYLLLFGLLLKTGIFGMLFGEVIGIFLISGFANLMMANMYRMVLMSLEGTKPSISEMFKFDSNASNVVIASFVVGFATAVGSLICYIPGLIAGGLMMFTMPILVDRKLDAMSAIKLSIETLKKEVAMATLFFFVISLCASAGSVACGIGAVLTIAVMPIGVSMLYRDFLGIKSLAPDR